MLKTVLDPDSAGVNLAQFSGSLELDPVVSGAEFAGADLVQALDSLDLVVADLALAVG